MRSLSFILISILFLLTACGAGNPCKGINSPLPTEDCEKYDDTEDQAQCYHKATNRMECFFSGFRQKKLKHYGKRPKRKVKAEPLPQPQKKVEVEVIDYLKVGKEASLEGCLAALKLQEQVTLKNPKKVHIEGAKYTALLAVCINKM